MKNVHPDELLAFQEKERLQKENDASHQLTNVFVESGASEQTVFNAIVSQWVRTSLRPMSIVEDQGLIEVVRFANNAKTQLSIPSRQTVAEGVHAKASQYHIWTSLKRECFISLTLHYVDSTFGFHSWTLGVTEIPGKHDGDAIADVLVRCFSWWRLDLKRCAIFLRDGATNMSKACTTLGLRHMSCSAHSLHLVVGGALLIKSKERTSIIGDGIGSTGCQPGNQTMDVEIVSAFVDSSISMAPGVILQRSWWMDDQLEELEGPDDTQNVDSQSEPFEWINGDDIDDLCDSVATFVSMVEASSYTEISSDDMEAVRKIVLQFRKLSTYFHHSQKGSNRLEKLQADKKTPLDVMNDCPTRWNSTFTMLQRFVDLKGALEKFFMYLETPAGKKEFDDRSVKTLKLPTPEEWLTIRCLVVLRASFSVASDQLGAESYPTLVSLYFVISSLKAVLRNEGMFCEVITTTMETESYARQVHMKMQSVRKSFLTLMEQRFDSATEKENLWISLLDPYTTNSGLYAMHQRDQAKERLLEEMLGVKRASVRTTYQPSRPAFHSPEKTISNPKEKARREMQELVYTPRVNGEAHAMSDEDLKLSCRQELEKYIHSSCEANLGNNDQSSPSPLSWWKTHHFNFPIIATLARKWLGCVASSVPSERSFSTAGNTITKRRSALKADTVRDIIFMAQNVTGA
ncbi:Zinc finger BED domain-containing protein 1 [Phytophthora citrophthora]|uniref:Zinc finger BED domain-containing protein 1 n=1 Tax=Phytophthora citrophthora TaxID=4793 RepID=A0AAD9GUP8_9STRA|nr:Zinc finger BED domain-containing protein 1 [Phytophthora citrophthora]